MSGLEDVPRHKWTAPLVEREALEVEEEQHQGGKTRRPHTLTSELGVDGATTPSPDEGFQEEEKVNRVCCVDHIIVNTKLGWLTVWKGVQSPLTQATTHFSLGCYFAHHTILC